MDSSDTLDNNVTTASSQKTADDEEYSKVLVWDIEDITRMSDNHYYDLRHEFRHHHNQIVALFALPRHLLCGFGHSEEDVIHHDRTRMDNIRDDPGRYADFEKFYETFSKEVGDDGHIINHEIKKRAKKSGPIVCICKAVAKFEEASDYYWKRAKRCLKLVNKRSAESNRKYANVVIVGGETGIGLGAAELLITGCSSEVPIENIYSIGHTSRESIYERIQTRFGKKCSLIAVTSSLHTRSVAEKLKIPVWLLNNNDSLDVLYSVQRDFMLK